MRVAQLTVATLLLLPGLLSAQAVRLEFTPRVGYYAPLGDVGAAAPANGTWYLDLDRIKPTASLQLGLGVSRPGSPLSARVHGLMALESHADGRFECYPGLACPSILMNTTAEATIWAAVADLVVTPFDGRLRPFAALGAGVKRHSFAWPETAIFVESGEYSESALALHGGVGFELELAGAPLRLEVSDYWSAEGKGLQGTDANQVSRPRRQARHDLAVSLGWSIVRF
jgi:hypothetical protein